MYYNSLQYSLKVWLTSALLVPTVYVVYYLVSRGSAASVSANDYLVLLLNTVLLSAPVWLLFIIALDIVCKARLAHKFKKLAALIILEGLVLLLFTAIVIGFGSGQSGWAAYSDFVVIGTFSITMSIFVYKLKPVTRKSKKQATAALEV